MRDDALKDERSSLHAALPPDSGHTADNKRLTSKTKPNTAQETLKKSLWPDNSVTWASIGQRPLIADFRSALVVTFGLVD